MSRRSLSGATVPFEVTVIVPSLDQAESMATRSDGAMRCRDRQGQIYRIVHGEIQVFASTGGAHLGLAFLHEEMRIAHSGIARTPQSGILRYQRDGSAEAWMKELLNFGNARVQSRDQRTPYVAESWSHRLLAGEVSGKGWTAGGKQGLRRVGVGHPRRAMHQCRWRPVRRLPMPSDALRSPAWGTVEVLAHDPTGHILCHPTGVTARGSQTVVASLGRWRLSSMPVPSTRDSRHEL